MGMLLRRHRKGKAEVKPTKVVDKPTKEPKKQKK